MEGKKKKQLIIGIIIGLGFMALPLFIEGYWIRVMSSIFMYAIITGALNIIAGFAGYAAFGNIVFFGIGAYTTAMLMLRVGLSLVDRESSSEPFSHPSSPSLLGFPFSG